MFFFGFVLLGLFLGSRGAEAIDSWEEEILRALLPYPNSCLPADRFGRGNGAGPVLVVPVSFALAVPSPFLVPFFAPPVFLNLSSSSNLPASRSWTVCLGVLAMSPFFALVVDTAEPCDKPDRDDPDVR